MSAEDELKDLYARMYHAMIQKDRNVLEDVLDESFVLVHMTGMHQNREVYISSIENGTLNYYSEDQDDIEVHVHDAHAEVIGKSRVHAAVFGGGRYIWKLQQDLKAEKKEGKWKFTESKASTYGI